MPGSTAVGAASITWTQGNETMSVTGAQIAGADQGLMGQGASNLFGTASSLDAAKAAALGQQAGIAGTTAQIQNAGLQGQTGAASALDQAIPHEADRVTPTRRLAPLLYPGTLMIGESQ